MKPEELRYALKPWKKYTLPDNGIYGPKGSNPTFHVESNAMRYDCNPLHPHVQGYIMHDEMPGDYLVPIKRIFVTEILDIDTE